MTKTKTAQLATKHIRIDGGTQSREELDETVIGEYSEAMEAGATFPPCVVFYDGSNNWLADGFHRYFAAKKINQSLLCEVHSGTRRDAILYSVGANYAHGVRRKPGDKRRGVEKLLSDAEWSAKSNVWIADQCNCAESYVRRIRDELSSHSAKIDDASGSHCANLKNTRTGKDGKEYPAFKQSTPDDAETDGYGRPLSQSTPTKELDPDGVYIETKTEVVNADIPEETKPVTLDDLSQEQQDALSDVEWLIKLPLMGKLESEGMDTRLFTDAALNWRRLRKAYQALRREAKACINDNAPDAYSVAMRSAVAVRHPKEWKFSRAAPGGYILW